MWCRGPELNWGHADFQSAALPTELPRQTAIFYLRLDTQSRISHNIENPNRNVIIQQNS